MRRELFWRHCRAASVAIALTMAAADACAQGMMDHVDFTSPEMSAAELTRADVEALIAKARAGRAHRQEPQRPRPVRARPHGRRPALGAAQSGEASPAPSSTVPAWISPGRSRSTLPARASRGRAMFQAQLPRAKLDRADLSGARIIGELRNAAAGGCQADRRRRRAGHAQSVDGPDACDFPLRPHAER